MWKVWWAALAVSAALFLGGCLTKDDAIAARDTAGQAVADLEGLAAALEQQRDAALARAETLEGDLAAAQREAARLLTERLVDAREAIERGQAILVRADEAIARWDDGTGIPPLDVIGETLLPMLPAPLQVPAILALAGAGAVQQWLRNRGAVKAIVKSIEKAKEESPAMERAIEENAATIRSVQGAAVGKLVDRLQRAG